MNPNIPGKKVELSKVKISFAGFILLLLIFSYFFFPLVQKIWVKITGPVFTIVALPDTQKYTRYKPEIFCEQTAWIADNRKKENIIFVTHMGDIVDSWKHSKKEWEAASLCMSNLDNVVPYSVIPGNHDTETGSRVSGFDTYNKFFPVSRYSSNSWYKGNYRENANSFQIIEKFGIQFLFLNLEIEPSDNALKWADDIAKKYPRAYIIVSTHKYLPEGPARDNARSYSDNGNTGQQIWEKLIKKNCNIRIVWSGHFHVKDGEFNMSNPNDCGIQVQEIQQDYQERPNGGDGKLRLYRFDLQSNEIKVQTYSPHTKTFEIDADSEFTMPFIYNYPWRVWTLWPF